MPKAFNPEGRGSKSQALETLYYYYRSGVTVGTGGIGMDMDAPYGVYLEGRCVGVYDDEEEAAEHFFRLRAQVRAHH